MREALIVSSYKALIVSSYKALIVSSYNPRGSWALRLPAMKKGVTRKADHAALTLALDRVLKRDPDPGRRARVRAMLKQNGWYEAATFSAYHLQIEALRKPLDLKPWHSPPCHIDACPRTSPRRRDSSTCASGALGISRFHPDPLMAVATAEQHAAEATQRVSPAHASP